VAQALLVKATTVELAALVAITEAEVVVVPVQ
jgi:hypothetical protein